VQTDNAAENSICEMLFLLENIVVMNSIKMMNALYQNGSSKVD